MRRLTVVLLGGVALVAAFALAGCGGETTRANAPDTPAATGTAAPPTPAEEPVTPLEEQKETSIKGPQYVDIEKYELVVDGMVDRPLRLKYSDILAMQADTRVVRLDCVEGWGLTARWTGVPLEDILNLAGVKAGAKEVIFRAVDGYSSSLHLDYATSGKVLLAYLDNGEPLSPERGFPLQVVAEGKWGYKWVKWLDHIQLIDQDFRGYWELWGFNNEGDAVSGLEMEPGR